MMRIASWGHAAFAAVLIALGIQGLITGDFTAIWQPVPKSLPAREALAYLCAIVSLTSGVGLLLKPIATAAARLLLASLLIWNVPLRVPAIAQHPADLLAWYGLAEPAVIIAGAWVLYAWFAGDWDRQHLGFAVGESGLRIARVIFGLCLIPFGIAHFAYLERTSSMVPGYLPAHLFWAKFFGVTFIAAGAGIALGVFARLAASLVALQIGMFATLVWQSSLAAGTMKPFDWIEFTGSVAIAAGGWVVADSYRNAPWLAVGKR